MQESFVEVESLPLVTFNDAITAAYNFTKRFNVTVKFHFNEHSYLIEYGKISKIVDGENQHIEVARALVAEYPI